MWNSTLFFAWSTAEQKNIDHVAKYSNFISMDMLQKQRKQAWRHPIRPNHFFDDFCSCRTVACTSPVAFVWRIDCLTSGTHFIWHECDKFHFDDDVTGVRAAAADADVSFTSTAADCVLQLFSPVMSVDVMTRTLPGKQWGTDPSSDLVVEEKCSHLASIPVPTVQLVTGAGFVSLALRTPELRCYWRRHISA
jgi:hypothetical protein